MKLSIAIADTDALPTAFVVYRGFRECIPKAARLGFDGVELALRRAAEINVPELRQMLDENNIEVSCISTGQVYADGGLMLTDENSTRREQVKSIFRELIDLAADFGKIVNIGRVRGQIGSRPKAAVEDIFVEVARELCSYALVKNVSLALEPVNRYEIDFINNVEEGGQILEKIDMPNMRLMPDLFHMNMEDRSIKGELAKHARHIGYVHFADSNREAPGQGHLNFKEVFNTLYEAGYNGWISTEILPKPDPDTAARRAAAYLLPMIKIFNERLSDKQRNFAF